VDPSLAKDLITGAIALASVLVAGLSVFQVARTAQKGRSEQRAADAYLAVLRLVEQEVEWLDLRVAHLAGPEWDTPPMEEVPKPVVGDRATAAAYLAAYGSAVIRAKHATWRDAADHVYRGISGIEEGIHVQHDRPGPQDVYQRLEEVQAKEGATRQALEDAIARELRHR
jgi:hypothetical protein